MPRLNDEQRKERNLIRWLLAGAFVGAGALVWILYHVVVK